jgi:Kef-type K+ transport system membrane component KefB
MDVNQILADLLIVLLAARLAAEVADRLRLPAVVGEITAGILIGPSVLDLVQGGEVLATLAELGVILLLVEVGLEMDLAELGAVGRAALSVASVGVVVPFALGAGAGVALGMSGEEAIFVGAALTATSVGITARVFGDLRQLASIEARTVLGAAVADDVMGLVILTVVTRVVTEGSVSVLGVLGVVGVALAFLVAATAIGTRLVPPLFGSLARSTRIAGGLLVFAVVVTLALAELAHAADLAPIIGAFVAGLALGRSSVAPRIRRDLAPVAHLLVPIFFVGIGLEVEVGEFAHLDVLALSAALFAVAVAGKLASSLGLLGAPGDRLVVGLGMLPRGEVGLIFAAIGLREAVFGADVYAALLLVVLATTMVAPPLLRGRLLRIRRERRGAEVGELAAAAEGRALALVDGAVAVLAEPAPEVALATAFEAALLAERHPPHESLLEWLAEFPPSVRRVDERARAAFVRLLEEGGRRSWRVLTMGGVLDRTLPELASAVEFRQAHRAEIDPLAALAWPRVERLRELSVTRGLGHPERVLLAALALDVCDDTPIDPLDAARRTARRLGLGADAEEAVAGLVADRDLLFGAARRVDAFDEEPVLQLGAHLAHAEQARALYALTLAGFEGEVWERERLDTLQKLVEEVLERPELTGFSASHDVDARRDAAMSASTDVEVRERVRHAPRAYVLGRPVDDLVRHATRCEPTPGRDELRVFVDDLDGRGWRVEIAARDEVGLMARETRALAERDLDVLDAVAVTWGDRTSLASYHVVGHEMPDAGALRARLVELRRRKLAAEGVPDAVLHFDDHGSPWHTRCRVEAPDVPGVLAALTAAFAVAGVCVHAARVEHEGVSAVDVFELSDRAGAKLDDATKRRIVKALSEGVHRRRPPVVGWR